MMVAESTVRPVVTDGAYNHRLVLSCSTVSPAAPIQNECSFFCLCLKAADFVFLLQCHAFRVEVRPPVEAAMLFATL